MVFSQWVGFLRLITSAGLTRVGFVLFLRADSLVSPGKLGTRYGEVAGTELWESGEQATCLGAKIWAAQLIKLVVKYSGFLHAWCTAPPCKYDSGLSNPLVAALAGTPAVQHEHVWVSPGSWLCFALLFWLSYSSSSCILIPYSEQLHSLAKHQVLFCQDIPDVIVILTSWKSHIFNVGKLSFEFQHKSDIIFHESESIPTSQSAQLRLKKLSCLPSVSSPVCPPPSSFLNRLANFNHIWKRVTVSKAIRLLQILSPSRGSFTEKQKDVGLMAKGRSAGLSRWHAAPEQWRRVLPLVLSLVELDVSRGTWWNLVGGGGEDGGDKEHKFVGKQASLVLLFLSLFLKLCQKKINKF